MAHPTTARRPKTGPPRSPATLPCWRVAVAIAIVSARDLAGGWNDGSRLATVESLVDYHTLAIDDSAFVKIRWPAAYYERPDAYQSTSPG